MSTQLTPLIMDQATVLTVTDLDLVAANAAGNFADIDAPHRTFIAFQNGSGGPVTVTVETKEESNQEEEATIIPSVPNGEIGLVGPFKEWQVDAGGQAYWGYSAVGTCEVAVIKCGE